MRLICLYIVLAVAMAQGCEAMTLREPISELGRALFFSTSLSADGKIACATCHQPEKAFADGLPVAQGVFGRRGQRNTPSLLALPPKGAALMWDGRHRTLEQSVIAPFIHPAEHGLSSHDEVLTRLSNDPVLSAAWKAAHGSDTPTLTGVSHALSAFVTSLRNQTESTFDRFLRTGHGLSSIEQRGWALFRGPAGCSSCHRLEPEQLPSLVDDAVHASSRDLKVPQSLIVAALHDSNGWTTDGADRRLAQGPLLSGLGRFVVTGDPRDIGAFRTPSLRNVAQTAPFMHDGRFATLRDAVEAEAHERWLRDRAQPILTPADIDALVAFLETLTSPRHIDLKSTSAPARRPPPCCARGRGR